MLLPRPDAQALLPKLERDGVVGSTAPPQSGGSAGSNRDQSNPRFLNAEDQTTLDGPKSVSTLRCSCKSEIALMRGAPVGIPNTRGVVSRCGDQSRTSISPIPFV
jgi:hypothetical protein